MVVSAREHPLMDPLSQRSLCFAPLSEPGALKRSRGAMEELYLHARERAVVDDHPNRKTFRSFVGVQYCRSRSGLAHFDHPRPNAVDRLGRRHHLGRIALCVLHVVNRRVQGPAIEDVSIWGC